MPVDIKKLKKFEKEDAPPHAGNMIEGYRSFGYALETAVADIIDNSIAAKSKNIWIDFNWHGDGTTFTITDDGTGMSLKDLVIAMTPSSRSPLVDRDSEDLGRFGLGLKTASFSQCRVLTVATKLAGKKIILRSWNMDYVHKAGWKLLDYLDDKKLIQRLKNIDKGTTVIWQYIDLLVKGTREEDPDDLKIFLDRIQKMEMHLAAVFHFFIEKRKLNIWINDKKIKAWDPYLSTVPTTQTGDETKLRNGIVVQPYVLPPTSDLVKEDFDRGAGIKGWNAHQGFYIYRNNRMIIHGEWLGMYKQEEHSKLSRIRVNLPNNVHTDTEWHLDIKKSYIQPPPDIYQDLKRIADESRKDAVNIYRQIGKVKRKESKKEDISVWTDHTRKGQRCYQINKEHPLIKSFIAENTDSNRSRVNRLFRLLEETLPLTIIIANESEHRDMQKYPFENKSESDLVTMIAELYKFLSAGGLEHEAIIQEILRTEPFNRFPELIENVQHGN